ncbi:NOP58 family protein [Salinarchaeum sp. IM2453]|uniref:NOP5/NOP56 family protein n=1 Tax=Salinarchaeum sp. IM2453 TaxID=2862870 RepID=UPI001C83451D|nr:NOP5/NOP56 family protein [Salinarchaeum sp. IM2453]QZA87578.1 NOP58 family protein [Salinarchaeum sp. IM2453]
MSSEEGWYVGSNPDKITIAVQGILAGSASEPAEWPEKAIEETEVTSKSEYYEWLQKATIEAARKTIKEQEQSSDQQLIHAVRAMDDCLSQGNEIIERVSEWAGSLYEETGTSEEYLRTVAKREPENETETQVISLANRGVDLLDQADQLQDYINQQAPTVAPNLSALSDPVLAARLIALAGGLEDLAKMPSSTVQVLGAEDALFAHLRGNAPSPKHGVIFTHEYVRETPQQERGSAARAFAGKLSIAARVDHYSGEYRPELEAELLDRIQTIQNRGDH